MAFVSQTRMVANAWLRPGNTTDNSSCKAFMQETFDDVLKDKKVGLVRADSGFYTEELMSCPEEEHHHYIMAVRMYPNVKSAVWRPGEWVELSRGIEVNEMIFSHEHGKPRRRDTPQCWWKRLFEEWPGHR